MILLRWLGGEAATGAVLGPTRRRPAPVEDDADEDADNDGDDDGDDDVADRADALRAEIAPRLTAAIADVNAVAEGAGRTLLLDALAARRKVSRAGFRREDRADPGMVAALRAGATAVSGVVSELDRLAGLLSAKAPGADLAGDTARFAAAFRRIYLGLD